MKFMKKLLFRTWSKQNRMLLRTAAASLLLFFITVGFSLLLSATMLRQYTTEAILNGYGTAASQLQMLINRGLNFGRPLNGFVGLQEHLIRTQGMVPGIENIAVYNAEGMLITSVTPPQRTWQSLGKAPNLSQTGWKRDGNDYRILPLGEKGYAKPDGYMVLSVSKSWTEQAYTRYLHSMLLLLIFLAPLICMAKLGWFAYFTVQENNLEHFRSLLSRSILVFIGGAQVLFVGIAIWAFMGELHAATTFSAELSGKFMVNNLEMLVHKKLQIQNFPGLQANMAAVLEESPALGGMRLSVGDTILVQAGHGFNQTPVNVPVYRYWANQNTARTQIAAIDIYPDKTYREKIVWRMLLDQLTSLAIAFVMLLQLSNFLASHILQHRENAKESGLNTQHDEARLKTIFFVFFCAYDFVMSFVPLAAAQLPSNFVQLSPSLHNALPVSAEATFATLAVIASGILNRSLGWKRMLYLALSSGMFGAFLAYLANDIAWFILARACSGFAMGMIIMSGQFCVIEKATNRLGGLAGMYAALFAGSICGSASGGMLYEFFSPHTLFGFSSGLLIIPFLMIFPLSNPQKKSAMEEQETNRNTSWKAFLTPSFLAPTLLISVPAGMSLTGFLYFTFPTVMKQLHFEQADIGRNFMLYGFCFVFIGPYLAKIAEKSRSQLPFVVCTGLTAGIAIIVASLMPTLLGFSLAALFMGVSQCLISSSMLVYILSLPSMQNLDGALVGSTNRMFERIGQIIGPVLFGAALAYGVASLLFLGLFCMASACAFMMFRKK